MISNRSPSPVHAPHTPHSVAPSWWMMRGCSSGDGGFGYDPIFAVDGQTFAELTPDQKNARSHRGRALAAFARWYAAQDTSASGPG
jgi:hypothetical protein